MRDIIIQQGVGPYRPHLLLGRPLHAAYAARHGFEFASVEHPIGNQWSNVEKFTIPLSYMTRSGRWVMMADADVLIVGEEDFRGELKPDTDYAAVRNVWGEFNNGVCVYRDTALVIDFLLRCVDDLPAVIASLANSNVDQLVFNRNLQHSPLKCQALNKRWNCYSAADGCVEKPVQVYAWHDMAATAENKFNSMKNFLEMSHAAPLR